VPVGQNRNSRDQVKMMTPFIMR